MLCVVDTRWFGDDLIGDQVHAVCGSESVIILDSGNVRAIHLFIAGRSRFRAGGIAVAISTSFMSIAHRGIVSFGLPVGKTMLGTGSWVVKSRGVV